MRGPDVDPEVSLVHKKLFWVAFAQLTILENFSGQAGAKTRFVVMLGYVVSVFQMLGKISVQLKNFVTKEHHQDAQGRPSPRDL